MKTEMEEIKTKIVEIKGKMLETEADMKQAEQDGNQNLFLSSIQLLTSQQNEKNILLQRNNILLEGYYVCFS
jgi:hypothetical protein